MTSPLSREPASAPVVENMPDLGFVLDDEPGAVHRYPRHPAFRRSGADYPQPGDIARCGHVKATPSEPEPPACTCVRCERLARLPL